jgi:hypothetical protein
MVVVDETADQPGKRLMLRPRFASSIPQALRRGFWRAQLLAETGRITSIAQRDWVVIGQSL